jgi:hypothetical protein
LSVSSRSESRGLPGRRVEPVINPGTTSQYWRGDKTWQTLDKGAVGLSNVPNIDATSRANHTGTQLASTISDFSIAADARINTQKGAAGGLAPLAPDGKIASSYLPAIAISGTSVVASQAAMRTDCRSRGYCCSDGSQQELHPHDRRRVDIGPARSGRWCSCCWVAPGAWPSPGSGTPSRSRPATRRR